MGFLLFLAFYIAMGFLTLYFFVRIDLVEEALFLGPVFWPLALPVFGLIWVGCRVCELAERHRNG